MAKMVLALGRLPDGDVGRARFLPNEWKAIKESVDCYRSGDFEEGDIYVLQHFDLWDYENACLNELRLKAYYMDC